MRRAIKVNFITDPQTLRRYAIPAGGADDTDLAPEDQQGTDTDTDVDDSDMDDVDTDSDSDESDDEPLGPAGEKALREMKKRARAAERELRKLREPAKPDDSNDDASDPQKIREQVESEVRAEAAKDRALDKVEAKAARKFQNPDLVRKLLADQADDFLDEQGKPDVEAITEALDELLEDEPYLGLDAAQRRRFEGKADGGSRNGSKPTQLTKADLAGMSPAEIVKADEDGRLDSLRGRT